MTGADEALLRTISDIEFSEPYEALPLATPVLGGVALALCSSSVGLVSPLSVSLLSKSTSLWGSGPRRWRSPLQNRHHPRWPGRLSAINGHGQSGIAEAKEGSSPEESKALSCGSPSKAVALGFTRVLETSRHTPPWPVGISRAPRRYRSGCAQAVKSRSRQ